MPDLNRQPTPPPSPHHAPPIKQEPYDPTYAVATQIHPSLRRPIKMEPVSASSGAGFTSFGPPGYSSSGAGSPGHHAGPSRPWPGSKRKPAPTALLRVGEDTAVAAPAHTLTAAPTVDLLLRTVKTPRPVSPALATTARGPATETCCSGVVERNGDASCIRVLRRSTDGSLLKW